MDSVTDKITQVRNLVFEIFGKLVPKKEQMPRARVSDFLSWPPGASKEPEDVALGVV